MARGKAPVPHKYSARRGRAPPGAGEVLCPAQMRREAGPGTAGRGGEAPVPHRCGAR